MNIDYISTFHDDIEKYITHNFTELAMTEQDSFTLFQYGPYIAMKYTNLDYEKTMKEFNFKNPLFRLMVEISFIIRLMNQEKKISIAKKELLSIISYNQLNPFAYSNKVIDIARGIIQTIKQKQYEDRTLESAMLNYCPIVPYMGTIVKPEMEHHDVPTSLHYSLNEIEQKMKDLLVTNIIEILQNCDKFVNIDDTINQARSSKEYTIPYELVKIDNCTDTVSEYFKLVIIRYLFMNEDYDISYENYIKINKAYNNIIKGNKIDIKEAIESFSLLSLPDSAFIYK